MTCMIADDSDTSRMVMKALLESMGHQIIAEAIDGQDAYTKYSEVSPDFITMDINMPKLDGISASRNIIRKDAKAKILLISAETEPKLGKLCENQNVCYITKPIDRDSMIAALGQLAGN